MVDNAACYQTIEDWIKELQNTSEDLKKLPEKLVPVVKAECDKSIAAGQSLDGDTWAPRKDGEAALQGAAKDVDVTATGNVILITIKGGLVYSQWGTKHQRRRSILPIKGLPFKLGNAIAKGVADMPPAWLNRAKRHHKFGSGK